MIHFDDRNVFRHTHTPITRKSYTLSMHKTKLIKLNYVAAAFHNDLIRYDDYDTQENE